MEPQIRYARTSDGVNIAFSTLGEGPPLVVLHAAPSYLPMAWEWAIPEYRAWYEKLGETYQVVRLDGRGCGMSDLEPPDRSLDAMASDVGAVIDALPVEDVVILAMARSGPVAINYVAAHPEKVSRLLLFCAWSDAAQYTQGPSFRALLAAFEADWDIFTETLMQMAFGWHEGTPSHRAAAAMRRLSTPGQFRAVTSGMADANVTPLLGQVRVPTVVIHRPDHKLVRLDHARAIAAAIPGAQLVLLPGESLLPFIDEPDAAFAALRAAIDDVATSQAGSAVAGAAVRTILFTDLVGHTEMMQRLGDTKGRDVLREHERITRDTLKQHGGAEVKTMGDGFMASFGSVTSALDCAIALQRAFATHTESMPEPLHVRVGLNAGEPIEEDGDLFGATVILASRIAAKAGPGEILVPDTVRGLLSGKGFVFGDRGEFVPKGFDEGVRLWDVRWRE
jgi:class 3 adenylate cyclase